MLFKGQVDIVHYQGVGSLEVAKPTPSEPSTGKESGLKNNNNFKKRLACHTFLGAGSLLLHIDITQRCRSSESFQNKLNLLQGDFCHQPGNSCYRVWLPASGILGFYHCNTL